MTNDDALPATKGDVRELAGRMKGVESNVKELSQRMGKVKGGMEGLGGRMEKVEGRMENVEKAVVSLEKHAKHQSKGIDQVLTVLTNIDKRLTEKVDDHEERIVRLEDEVGVPI